MIELTYRERLALFLMARGESDALIARKVGFSQSNGSQSRFRKTLFAKIGARNKPNASAIAVRDGLLTSHQIRRLKSNPAPDEELMHTLLGWSQFGSIRKLAAARQQPIQLVTYQLTQAQRQLGAKTIAEALDVARLCGFLPC